MYYEFTIHYPNGSVSIVTVEQQEFSDQQAYCREGKQAGWIESYDYEQIVEKY